MASLTAIIVDDEPGLAELFSDLLELQMVKIVGIGHTGMDALRLVNAKNPNIVFLDINMPKMDRIEALKEIKKINLAPKVVMVTGNKYVNKKELFQFGADALIFKPFKMEQILDVLEKIEGSMVPLGS